MGMRIAVFGLPVEEARLELDLAENEEKKIENKEGPVLLEKVLEGSNFEDKKERKNK